MKKNFVFKSPGLQIRNSMDADYQPMGDEIASLSYKSASASKTASASNPHKN